MVDLQNIGVVPKKLFYLKRVKFYKHLKFCEIGLKIQDFANFSIFAVTFELYAIKRFCFCAAFVDPPNLGIEPKFNSLSCTAKILSLLQIWPKTSKSLDFAKFEMTITFESSKPRSRAYLLLYHVRLKFYGYFKYDQKRQNR